MKNIILIICLFLAFAGCSQTVHLSQISEQSSDTLKFGQITYHNSLGKKFDSLTILGGNIKIFLKKNKTTLFQAGPVCFEKSKKPVEITILNVGSNYTYKPDSTKSFCVLLENRATVIIRSY